MPITIKFELPQVLDRFYVVKFHGRARFNGKVARVIDYGEPYYYADTEILEKAYAPTEDWTVFEKRPDGICDVRRFADYLDDDSMYSDIISILKGVYYARVHGSILHEGPVNFGDEMFMSKIVPGSRVLVVSKMTPDAPDAEPVLGLNIKYAFYPPGSTEVNNIEYLDYLTIGKLINMEGNNAVILFDL